MKKVKQDVYLYTVDTNNANSEMNTTDQRAKMLGRRIELQEVNIDTMKKMMEQIRSDYEASDRHYLDYIQKLKKTALDAQDQIGGLQDDLYQKENWIRDL